MKDLIKELWNLLLTVVAIYSIDWMTFEGRERFLLKIVEEFDKSPLSPKK